MIRVVLLFLMLFPKTATFCRDIYGYINDVNGNPVPNAAVRIMQKNGTILIGQTETDSIGMFRVKNMPEDTITLVVSHISGIEQEQIFIYPIQKGKENI